MTKYKSRIVFNRLLAMTLAFTILLEYNSMQILNANAAGTSNDVISIASNQIGYHEKGSNSDLEHPTANSGSGNYNRFARDLGVANGQPWCATFVWWVMQSAGMAADRYPQRTTCTRDWFRQRGIWHDRGTYTPKPGDYICFGNVSHCGIVWRTEGNNVVTIEGNSGDRVATHTYSMGNGYILGYGEIRYDAPSTSAAVVSNDNPGTPYPVPCGVLKWGSRGDGVKWVQKFANDVMGAGIDEDGIYGQHTEYAVRQWQIWNGLTQDGMAGPQTIGNMLAKWREKVNNQAAKTNSPVTTEAVITKTPATTEAVTTETPATTEAVITETPATTETVTTEVPATSEIPASLKDNSNHFYDIDMDDELDLDILYVYVKVKNNTAMLSWDDVVDAYKYKVTIYEKNKGKWKNIRSVTVGNTTKLRIKKLKHKTRYKYKVVAIGSDNSKGDVYTDTFKTK